MKILSQEILFEVIRQGLNFALALNYVRLTARGSAYKLNAKRTGRRTIDALNHSTSLDQIPPDADDPLSEFIPSEDENPQFNIDLKDFFETLTDTEREILNMVLEGFTVREICKLKKISAKHIAKSLIQSAKKHLNFSHNKKPRELSRGLENKH
jgi:DNA-directed RNA polymerase specialized sigma24 family protein